MIATRVLLLFRSEERIYARPYLEDSFYLFNCAEHLAHGDGFTCDGIHPTNGVQPLIVVLYTPLFLIAGADKVLALRLGFILIAICDCLCIILLYKTMRILQRKPEENLPIWKSPPIIVASLWAMLYPIIGYTATGMETGLYSLLLLASFFKYVQLQIQREKSGTLPLGRLITFGIILGLAVLARVDAVFLVGAIAIYEISRDKQKGIRTAGIISATSLLISSPWWIYNYTTFGSFMPQSGISESLQTGVLAENLRRGAIVIGDLMSVFIYLPSYDLPTWIFYGWLITLGLFSVWIVRRLSLRKYFSDRYRTNSFTPFIFFCFELVIYYIFFFSAPHFLPRYFHPLKIIWLMLFASICPPLIERSKKFISRHKIFGSTILGLSFCCAFGFSAWLYVYNFIVIPYPDFYQTGKFALNHPNERIGMEQAGTAGFMAPNIVNLDGKVNFDALKARLGGDIGRYIEDEHLDYIADNHPLADPMLASAAKHGGKFVAVDSFGLIILYKRVK